MYEIFERLLKSHNVTSYRVSKETGVTQTALSNWKTGKSTPSSKNLQKIADYFSVTVDYLMNGEESEPNLEFTKKNERDIKAAIDAVKNQLSSNTGLMYDGEPIDEESQQAILAAVEVLERTAILEARRKFTPNKYKK